MNFKTTALLLLLLLGSAGLYLGTRGGKTPAAAPPAADPALGRPLVNEVTFRRLVIEHGGTRGPREAYRLEDGVWWQVQPVHFPVDAKGPESIINAALSLAPRQKLTPRGDDDTNPDLDGVPTRADLGLGPQADRVVIVGGEDVFNLVLGRREVAGTAWLAVDGGGLAYLVDPTLHDAVAAAAPDAWRPAQLPGPGADTVVGLTLEQRGRSADETAVLHRGAAGWHWGPDHPAIPSGDDEARGDRDATNRLAAIADGLPIAGYVTDDLTRQAELGLADPVATLVLRALAVSDNPGAEHTSVPVCTLRLGRPADASRPPSRYATASFGDEPSPVVFVVPGAAVAPLLADPVTLRDPRLVVADPSAVLGLRIDRVGSGTLELAWSKSGESGRSGAAAERAVRFVEPNRDTPADPRWGADWLTLLQRTRAEGFTSAPPEAQAPVATATLRLAADRVEHVRLYRDRDGRSDVMLAVREDEPVAAVVPAETLAPLLAPAITLRDTRLPAPEGEGIETVRLTRDDGVVFAFSRLDGDSPELQVIDAEPQPVAERWDVPALRRLQDWLRAPRAVQWTPSAGLPRGPVARLTTGPDAPAYTVNVGQNLAQRTDLPGVFRIAPEIAALFDAEYRPRVLIEARADELTAVALRDADGVTPADHEPAGLRDRLAGLRAERWQARPPQRARPAGAGHVVAAHRSRGARLDPGTRGHQRLAD